VKSIVLVGPPWPLEHEHVGVGREARRVRGARGTVEDLALADQHDPFLPRVGEIVQLHIALEHVHDLVARVDVEFAPVLPAPRDEGDRPRRLPQDAHRLGGRPEHLRDSVEIDGAQLSHGASLRRRARA